MATNGYRHRIPYGTLLSVSDLPLHATDDPERLRTRKLRRAMGEVPFR